MKNIPAISSDLEILSEIKKITAQCLVDWFGSNASFDDTLPILQRYPNSFMVRFRVLTSDGDEAVLVKIPSKPYFGSLADAIASDVSKARVQEQYSASKAVWNAIKDEGDSTCCAVPPPQYLEKWNALAMKEIQGQMLKSYLLKPAVSLGFSHSWHQLSEAVARSSRWLRIVHSRACDVKMEPFPTQEVQALIDETLEKLEQDSRGRVEVQHYQSLLQNLLESVSKTVVPVGLLHDDYHYSNILITPDLRACALDYAFTHRGPIYADLATMLIDPETRLAQILSLGLFLSEEKLAQLHSLIIDNYFQGKPHDSQVLILFCVIAILYKWSVDEKRFGGNGLKRLYSPLLVPIIRRHFRYTLNTYSSKKWKGDNYG